MSVEDDFDRFDPPRGEMAVTAGDDDDLPPWMQPSTHAGDRDRVVRYLESLAATARAAPLDGARQATLCRAFAALARGASWDVVLGMLAALSGETAEDLRDD